MVVATAARCKCQKCQQWKRKSAECVCLQRRHGVKAKNQLYQCSAGAKKAAEEEDNNRHNPLHVLEGCRRFLLAQDFGLVALTIESNWGANMARFGPLGEVGVFLRLRRLNRGPVGEPVRGWLAFGVR